MGGMSPLRTHRLTVLGDLPAYAPGYSPKGETVQDLFLDHVHSHEQPFGCGGQFGHPHSGCVVDRVEDCPECRHDRTLAYFLAPYGPLGS